MEEPRARQLCHRHGGVILTTDARFHVGLGRAIRAKIKLIMVKAHPNVPETIMEVLAKFLDDAMRLIEAGSNVVVLTQEGAKALIREG